MIEVIPGGVKTVVFAACFAGAALMGAVLIPLFRRLGIGQTVREDGPSTHIKKSGTPTMGGLIFVIPMAVAVLTLSLGDTRLLPPLLVTLGFGLVGFIDDLIIVIKKRKDGLSPRQKSAGLIACALVFALYNAFGEEGGTVILLPLTGLGDASAPHPCLILPWWIYVPFTVFVCYATANAVNFTDGVDGLCSSVTFVVMAAFTVAAGFGALGAGGSAIAALGAALAGGLLGFLLFNAHPARVFMGDCGSLALGGAVAALAVALRVPWIILFFGLVYVAEALSVVIQISYYKRTRRRIFKMAPVHHHLELSGWKEGKVVAVFTAVTLLSCAVGFFLLFGRIFS